MQVLKNVRPYKRYLQKYRWQLVE